ncbi:hypothetical protein [Methanolapillus africanus]
MEEMSILDLLQNLCDSEESKWLLLQISESLNDPEFDFEKIIERFISREE